MERTQCLDRSDVHSKTIYSKQAIYEHCWLHIYTCIYQINIYLDILIVVYGV